MNAAEFTLSRRVALEGVATGRVIHELAPRGRWSLDGFPLPTPTYRWLLNEGFISLGPREGWFKRAALTDAGRRVLLRCAPERAAS